MFRISIIKLNQVVFEGSANSVVLPGEEGEFEIMDFHRDIMSLLKRGNITIDGIDFPIEKGIANFAKDKLDVFVEI
jgi:F0F1-type ATP synthase epsilon subunit